MSNREKRACIVVLGDIGRSPRMQYHAQSLIEENYFVDIVGYLETKPMDSIISSPKAKIHEVFPFPEINLPAAIKYLLKCLWQAITLFSILISIKRPQVVFVQNPPGIPTLLLCYWYCLLTKTKFFIDWHNYTYTILALSSRPNGYFVRLAKWLESICGRKADVNFCVTKAMKDDLQGNWGIKFPKSEILRRNWMEAIGSCNYPLNNDSYVCSEHFLEEDLFKRERSTKLMYDAIPQLKLNQNYKEEIVIEDLENVEIKSDDPNFNFKITVIDEKKLIQKVKSYPDLYDPKSKDYAKTIMQNNVWKAIGSELNLSPKRCCSLWMNMKSSYSKYFTMKPAIKSTELQKEMNFLWPLYIKSFYNEVYFCTDNNKFILDRYGEVTKGINYHLIKLISKYPIIYDMNSNPQDIGPHQAEIWENIAQQLKQSIKYCFQRFLRLRKHYLEILTKIFKFPNEKPKVRKEFEIRMKFMWGSVKKLFPNAPQDFYDDIDESSYGSSQRPISDRTNSPELIIPDDYEESTYHDRIISNSCYDKDLVTADGNNMSDIQNKYSEELKRNLINIVEEYPVLYDEVADSPLNWADSTDQNIWEHIANEISCSEKECFDLWNSLKETFAQELKRNLNDSNYEITWEFYGNMEFLLPHIKDKILTLAEKKENHIQKIIEVCKTKEDEVFKLITIIRRYPVLYMGIGKKYIDNNTRKYKRNLWNFITKDMNWNDNECRDVWRYLYKKYSIFLKMDYEEEEISIYKEALSFLKQYLIEQKNPVVLSSEDEDEDENIEYTNEQLDDIEKSIIEDQISIRFEHQRLINCVSKHKNLYDYTIFNYADEDVSWKSISTELDIPENICSETWHKLRRRYLISNRKFKAQITEEDHFYLDEMSFLKPFITKYETEENDEEDDSECEEMVDDIEFPTEETKTEIGKIILKEVQRYPKIYLNSENKEYAQKAWESISEVVEIPASACKLIFLEAVDNYKKVFSQPFSKGLAKPFNLYDDMHFMKTCIESEMKKNNVDNCKKLIKTIRNYRSLYSSDISQCKTSTIWNKVAEDMSWTTEDCISQWKKIKDELAERIASKTFNQDWIYRDDLIFLKLSYIFDELSIDNLPSISEDFDLNLLVNEIIKYPCLYDSDLRTSKKELIWDVIGKHVKLSAEECKRFWGRLSSIYFKHMDRKLHEAPNASLDKFEIEMQFLKPFHKNSIQFAKVIEDNVNRIETMFTPREHWPTTRINSKFTKKQTKRKRISKLSESEIISLDSDDSSSNNIAEDKVIISTHHLPPVEVIAETLMKNNSNLGYDFFSITNFNSDSESDNGAGSSGNGNYVNHPKQSNLEQYFYSAHNIIKKMKK